MFLELLRWGGDVHGPRAGKGSAGVVRGVPEATQAGELPRCCERAARTEAEGRAAADAIADDQFSERNRMNNWKPQDFPDSAPTGNSRGFQNPRHYSMSPKTLNLDKSVSDGAFRVFSLLALQNYQNGRKTNLVQATTRDLAEQKGCSHTTIQKFLNELADCGYIEKLGKARGSAWFRLTSPVFETRTTVTTAPRSVVEVGSAELPAIRSKRARCPKCRKTGRISSSSGVCEVCLSEWVARQTA